MIRLSKSQVASSILIRLALIVQISLFLQSEASGQIVQGRILDANSQEPIEGVHVFINGTKNGVVSDKNGFYRFNAPNRPEFTLIFSHVSYDVQTFDFKGFAEFTKLDVQLKHATNLVGGVMVTARRDRKRERRLKEFKSFFFGKYHNPELIEIENEYVLAFEKVKNGGFQVQGQPVLKVMNKHLNYEIYFHLISFNSKNKSFFGYSDFSDLGSSYHLKPDSVEANRHTSYKGSLRHFFYALVNDKLDEEGFAASILKKVSLNGDIATHIRHYFVSTPLEFSDEKGKKGNIEMTRLDSGLYELYVDGFIEIAYFDELDKEGGPQISSLVLKGPVLVNKQGIVFNQEQVQIDDYLLNEGVYYALPFEYLPMAKDTPGN